MRGKIMVFAELWLPVIGAGICIAWAIGAWYGGDKIIAIWLSFAGAVCLLLLATLQWQQAIEKTPSNDGARTYLTMSFGAVVLNSPALGKVTAWIRIKNSGAVPAYEAKGWQKFRIAPTGQDPFGRTGEFNNEVILGAGEEVNLSSTLDLTAQQFAAIENRTFSFYVWGRSEYTDPSKQPRYLSFKGVMNGPPDTVIIDGARAEGWGFNAIKNGFDAN
jgi:hypothetical protein